METILTIDFDVIMWPSIELYNNFVDGKVDEMQDMEQDIPLIKYANADLQLYHNLTNYLLKLKSQNIQFDFITTHEEILDKLDTKCNIINIDHHHDLGYNKDQWTNDDAACGNWAYLGIKNSIIQSYIWLHGYMEMPFDKSNNYISSLNVPIIENNVLDMDYNNFIIPSKVIICASYGWIPTSIRPLYKLWEDLFKGEKK